MTNKLKMFVQGVLQSTWWVNVRFQFYDAALCMEPYHLCLVVGLPLQYKILQDEQNS